jgi:hypothetical protein
MPAATLESRASRPLSTPVRVRAFGLDLETGFAIPGAQAAPGGARRERAVRLELAARADILGAWRPGAPERLSTRRLESGRVALSIDADERAGYLIRAQGFGCFWISSQADLVRCAPLRLTTWRWQRYLIGQVLPLVAVLRGLEVFHSSAVVVDGRAVAFIGASTAGKTSIALNLVLGGAQFMTDDVLAVSPGPDGGVVAHPGIGLASLRHSAADLLGEDERRRLGKRLGRDRESSRVAIPLHGAAAPLERVYVIERRRNAQELRLEPLSPVDPRLLLGGSFNFIIRTPERLTNQLDLCSRLARAGSVHRAVVPPSVGPPELARAIERELAW